MAFQNILVSSGRSRGVVTFNRPEKLNPLDWTTLREIRQAVAELEADPSLRAIIFTGAGRAFSAGGDLAGYMSLYADPAGFRGFLDDFAALGTTIADSPKIYIACINGTCVAGGLELLLACDLAFAAETAKIGDGHINFAQIPGAGGSQRLPRAIGTMRAKHMMLSGRLVDGREAERLGLVAEAVPADQLWARVDAFVDELVSRSAFVTSAMKRLVNDASRLPLVDGLAREIELVHEYATTHPDAKEGLSAFVEKRHPNFARS